MFDILYTVYIQYIYIYIYIFFFFCVCVCLFTRIGQYLRQEVKWKRELDRERRDLNSGHLKRNDAMCRIQVHLNKLECREKVIFSCNLFQR